jgi:microsomal dipeptidase-like Zn-dependent dipeptidase
MALWRRGILVDVDHMSMKTKDATLERAEHFDVPVISSHCWVRDIALSSTEIGLREDWWYKWDGKTPSSTMQPTWPLLRHEGMRTVSDLERITKLGGITSFLLRQPAVRKPSLLSNVDGDGVHIMGTTTAAAAAYLRIVEVLGTSASIALGSDVNGLAQLPEASSCCVASTFDPYGPEGMPRSRTGDRIWDVDSDGMAHYGMLPDLVLRWRAEGVSKELLQPLLRSAEGYVETWDRSERAARDPMRFQHPAV